MKRLFLVFLIANQSLLFFPPISGMEKMVKEADVVLASVCFAGAGYCRYKFNALKEKHAAKKTKNCKRAE